LQLFPLSTPDRPVTTLSRARFPPLHRGSIEISLQAGGTPPPNPTPQPTDPITAATSARLRAPSRGRRHAPRVHRHPPKHTTAAQPLAPSCSFAHGCPSQTLSIRVLTQASSHAYCTRLRTSRYTFSLGPSPSPTCPTKLRATFPLILSLPPTPDLRPTFPLIRSLDFPLLRCLFSRARSSTNTTVSFARASAGRPTSQRSSLRAGARLRCKASGLAGRWGARLATCSWPRASQTWRRSRMRSRGWSPL
jgi:hypothetical protein